MAVSFERVQGSVPSQIYSGPGPLCTGATAIGPMSGDGSASARTDLDTSFGILIGVMASSLLWTTIAFIGALTEP